MGNRHCRFCSRVLTDSNIVKVRSGCRIRVEAKVPGFFFRGKKNVNTQHSGDPANEFSITILERDVQPIVSHITLSELFTNEDTFLFDETRATGPEHYQASLVHLSNLLLVDPAG